MTGAAAAVLAGLIGLAAVAAVQARSNRELKKANGPRPSPISTANARTSRTGRTTKASGPREERLRSRRKSRKRAEAVLSFLKDDVLAAARPEGQEGGLGKDVTVRKAVDAAEPKIAGAFKDQPIVEADVRDTLGHDVLRPG